MYRILAVASLLLMPVLAVQASSLEQEPSNLVQLQSSSNQILIPVAGSVQGAKGTFFRSDITILNVSSHDQIVNFRWMRQGGGENGSVDVTIPAHSGISSEDLVANVLGQQGVGSIIVSAVDANDQLDPNGALYATSRIWTVQPGGTGTTSQSFSVLSLAGSGPNSITTSGSIFGIRRDDRYRANVGIVNVSTAATNTFQVTLVFPPTVTGTVPPPPAESYTVTIPPMSMAQIALSNGTASPSQIIVQRLTNGTGVWTAYGSSVDNITGDAWSELAIPSPNQ